MYKNRAYNLVLVAVALLLSVQVGDLSRLQALVDDQAYMKGMIPHHSIAILTSERADIDDVRVRELADEIIKRAQRKEIKESGLADRGYREERPGHHSGGSRSASRPGAFEGTAASSLDGCQRMPLPWATVRVELP